jgi:hypothetical protein
MTVDVFVIEVDRLGSIRRIPIRKGTLCLCGRRYP